MNKVPMTKKGAVALQQELARLKTQERPKIIEAVATARAHGDLKENAEYHAARERQSFIEGRIRDIEGKLSNAEVIDIARFAAHTHVVFGATVSIQDEIDNKEKTYQIVGEDEANIKHHRISYASPIARSIMGKSVGDTCAIQAPAGERFCVIVRIEYIMD